MTNKLSSLTLCSLLALVACDGLAGDGYNGEVLASVQGSIRSEMTDPPPSAQAALVWTVSAGSPDTNFGEAVNVTGNFPAEFRLDLFVPPPNLALNDYTGGGQRPNESQIGVAHIAVMRGDLDLSLDQSGIDESDAYGAAEDYLVVYVDSDVQPGSFSAALLGGTLSAGYHLMDVYHMTDADIIAVQECQVIADTPEDYAACGNLFDKMTEASAGFGTSVPVRMVDDITTLNIPNWT